MKDSPSATILDVARAANVAPSTVSLVINERSGVSKATRKRVDGAIRKLGYRPRGSRAKSHIAVVYMKNLLVEGRPVQYCADWVDGTREGFRDQPVDVSVFQGQEHINEDHMFLYSLEQERFDGLIMMGVHPEDGYLDLAASKLSKIVVINRTPQRTEFSSVCADHFGGGRQAAERLMQAGHTRVALLFQRRSQVQQEVRDGFIAGLAERGLTPVFDSYGHTQRETIEALGKRVLDEKITAVFAGNFTCQQLGNCLLRQGVHIPEAVSLIGYSDLNLKLANELAISAIDYDARKMGALASRIMIQILESQGELVNLHAVTNTHYVPGQTIAKCSADKSTSHDEY